jgi:PAS domain S-box-containing protein
MSDQETITRLTEENSRLHQTVEKLKRELSRELIENTEQSCNLKDKDRYLAEWMRRHTEMENRYKFLAGNVNEMITIVDAAGIYLFANQRAAEFHGKTIEDIIGKSFREIIAPDILAHYEDEIFNPVLKLQQKVSGSFVMKRGDHTTYIEGHGHPVFNDAGVTIGVINITNDVTEKKQRQLYEEIDQQINFVQAMPMGMEEILRGVFITLCQLEFIDSGGIYFLSEETGNLELLLHYNLSDDFLKQASTYPPETPEFMLALAGIPVYDLIERAPPELRKSFQEEGITSLAVIPLVMGEKLLGCLNLACCESNAFQATRKEFIERVGRRITSLIELHKMQQSLLRTVEKLNKTISDLRINQQILIQKSKMESLGEFSAGMAHEINQPLVIISLSVENIQQKLNTQSAELSPVYLKRKFEAIQLNVKRIQQIINNLRVFALDQSGILFEKVNMAEAITNTLEMVAPRLRSERIIFKCEEVGKPIFVFGNLFKLEQVLLNLISNSIYALKQRQETDRNEPCPKQISLQVTRQDDRVIIDLTDNGIGIPEENLEKLFTPFFTTKMAEGGTGLGLPIVYGIIKEMNGEINITSHVNEFTRVRLTFQGI